MDGADRRRDLGAAAALTDRVVIVGAGPVGLTAALALARHGVPSVLLDRGDGGPCVGSRSICTARWSLEVFERLGCGRAMADEGVSWTVGRTYFRDTELFQTRFPAVGRETFPPFVNLGQQRVEEILLERVAAEPLIEARWGAEIDDVEQDAGEVRVRAGGDVVAGAYAIACDGQRSLVRGRLGVGFPGHSHADKFLILDVRARLDFADERRFFFDHPRNPGRQVLIHPQPGDVWRIDWQVPAETDLEDERRSGRLDRRVRDVIGDVPYEVVWESVYVFHQRRAERFRAGRVFLAGDAAHVFAPFGARGMNSGVQDAENLAWKLWLVLAGHAPDALLDTYEVERAAAADHNLAVTDATMRFMAPRSRARRLARDALLRASTRVGALRRHIDSGRLSEPFAYAGSPIVEGAGDVAPDGPCRPLAGAPPCRRVRDLLGGGFVALRFGAGGDLPRAPGGAPVEVLAVVGEGVDAGVPALADVEGVLREAYRARDADVVLIRPDGHVAAHRATADLDAMLRRAVAAA